MARRPPSIGSTAKMIVAERKQKARALDADWHVVILPKGPSVNAMFRNIRDRSGRQKGRAKTKRYVAWCAEAGRILRASQPKPIAAEYEVRIQLGRRKGSDLDNFAKAIGDLLQTHRVVTNDSLCERVTLEWGDDLPSNKCRVFFRPLARTAEPKRAR